MIVRNLAVMDYKTCLKKMQQFTHSRNTSSADELWVVQHNSIFTYGIRNSEEHLLHNPDNIPVIKSNRGGKITYHDLGQLIIYCLIDIKRSKITISQLINKLEQAIIDLLKQYNICANRKNKMPGVYVDDAKIAALGLKVSHGRTYHGISLNVNMDLTPFSYINPCGYQNLVVTQLKNHYPKPLNINQVADTLIKKILVHLVNA